MRSRPPLAVVVFACGLVLGAALSSDPWPASAQGPKEPKKSKEPKAAKEPKGPKGPKAAGKSRAPLAPRPSVQKQAKSSVSPQNGKRHLPEPQAQSDQQLIQAIRVLQSAKKTLNAADHDYNGQRAGAVKDISKAERQLKEALKHRGEKTSASGKTAPSAWHPEAQKLSDAQLRSQLPVLDRTIAVLTHADHDYGGHRAKAVSDLGVAVAQLKKALAVK